MLILPQQALNSWNKAFRRKDFPYSHLSVPGSSRFASHEPDWPGQLTQGKGEDETSSNYRDRSPNLFHGVLHLEFQSFDIKDDFFQIKSKSILANYNDSPKMFFWK